MNHYNSSRLLILSEAGRTLHMHMIPHRRTRQKIAMSLPSSAIRTVEVGLTLEASKYRYRSTYNDSKSVSEEISPIIVTYSEYIFSTPAMGTVASHFSPQHTIPTSKKLPRPLLALKPRHTFLQRHHRNILRPTTHLNS